MDYNNYQWSSQGYEPTQACEWCGENRDPIHRPYYANTHTYNPAWEDHQDPSRNYNNYDFEPQYFQSQTEKSQALKRDWHNMQ